MDTRGYIEKIAQEGLSIPELVKLDDYLGREELVALKLMIIFPFFCKVLGYGKEGIALMLHCCISWFVFVKLQRIVGKAITVIKLKYKPRLLLSGSAMEALKSFIRSDPDKDKYLGLANQMGFKTVEELINDE